MDNTILSNSFRKIKTHDNIFHFSFISMIEKKNLCKGRGEFNTHNQVFHFRFVSMVQKKRIYTGELTHLIIFFTSVSSVGLKKKLYTDTTLGGRVGGSEPLPFCKVCSKFSKSISLLVDIKLILWKLKWKKIGSNYIKQKIIIQILLKPKAQFWY